ncbi:MAG: serine/threonine-protein kinase [Planctomycetaceae bacterium]
MTDESRPPHNTPATPSLPEDPADEVIELDPTSMPDQSGQSYAAATDEATINRSLSSSASPEAAALLRSRLRAAAGFIAVAYLLFWFFALINPGTGYDLLGPSFIWRFLLGAAVCGLLASPLPFTYRQLRWLEYLFFGLSALLLIVSQYQVKDLLLERDGLIARVAISKNGVLRMWMLMMIYGVFIPNRPRKTATMILGMVVVVLMLMAQVMHQHLINAEFEIYRALALNAGANIVFILVGACLAIYSAYLLNDLRSELRAAQQLGQYRLIKKLGAGGMGEVYLAEHHLLKRPCAIKLINQDLEKNSIAIARFEREVHSTSMLTHPNTVSVYDYGIAEDNTFYFVMEFLPGLSLADLVRQAGALPPGRVVYLIRQVCGSLAEAHRAGLVHRDLKPANIFVAILGGQCDVAKVLDFGLVKQEQPTDGRQLTLEYTVSGTPSFMSPEQARGERDVDGRSDIYALGAVMYFMLSGKPPFERDSPMSIMVAQVSETPRPLSEVAPETPADLEQVVMRCLAKSPADRYPDPGALSAALAACRCARDWDQSHAEKWWIGQAAALELLSAETAEIPASNF